MKFSICVYIGKDPR